jgi:protein SCO1/2
MPFNVPDRADLDDVRPGDRVEGTLRVGPTSSALTGLTVTDPAPPQALSLDLSGGEAKLRPKTPLLEPGQAVPDFAMTTQDGRTLRLSDLRGKVVVLTFIYTRCPLPDFCPLMDRKISELASLVGPDSERAQKVRLLSVSFDPEHDTPEDLARHAKAMGARPPLWTFAVASHVELQKVAEPLGLSYGPTEREIIHTLSTAVIGPDGRLVRLERGRSWTPAKLFQDVRDQLHAGAR